MFVYDNFVRFKVDVTNNGIGEYNKYVLAPLFIINEITGTGEMVTYQNQAVNIPAGTTTTLYFDFDNLGYGYKYALNIYARNENDSLKNLVLPGQSKIYEIVHGVVVWTGDGERMGYQPYDGFQVPASAAAVNLEGLELNSTVPNATPNCLYYLGSDEAVPAGLEGRNVIKGNVAQGRILKADMTWEPCYIVRIGNSFAHGETIHAAQRDAMQKHMSDAPEEERLKMFTDKFPTLDTVVTAKELFDWHNILTGSCMMGRKQWCINHNINVDADTFTVKQFIKLTQNAFGGRTIKKLTQLYN